MSANLPLDKKWFDVYLNRTAYVSGKVTMDDWNQMREILGEPPISTGGQSAEGMAPAYDRAAGDDAVSAQSRLQGRRTPGAARSEIRRHHPHRGTARLHRRKLGRCPKRRQLGQTRRQTHQHESRHPGSRQPVESRRHQERRLRLLENRRSRRAPTAPALPMRVYVRPAPAPSAVLRRPRDTPPAPSKKRTSSRESPARAGRWSSNPSKNPMINPPRFSIAERVPRL